MTTAPYRTGPLALPASLDSRSNAAEIVHMLAINVALGFRPAGWDVEWQRIVAT